MSRPPQRPLQFPADRLRLTPGTMGDYHALARFHYRAGPPATRVAIHALRDPRENDAPVAVLVISMPFINASWRNVVWPGRYRTGDKRRDARLVNVEIRVLSRLIVDPRWRGLGLASHLARHYLANPLTPATEAVAAMGRVNPFLRNAGMTEYHLPPTPADLRLLDALTHAGVEPWRLADAHCAKLAARVPFIARELRVWARDSPTLRKHAAEDPTALAQLAASLDARPAIYAHTVGQTSGLSTHTNGEHQRNQQ